MKKVLFYTDTPLLGGAENQMYLLAKFLTPAYRQAGKAKYEISLACSRCGNLDEWCQKFTGLGLEVIRLKVAHKHDPRHFFHLKKILPNFDLLHMHIWNPASCRFGFLAAGKIPLVITEHDPFPLRGFKGWLKKKLMKNVKKIIVASQSAKKLVLEQDAEFSHLTTVIPLGIDIEQWRKQAQIQDKNEFRRVHLKTMQNEKAILCVAELNERKGQKYLIHAFKLLLDKFSNLKLIFVGEGPDRNHYEKLAKSFGNKIVFLGRKKEVAKLMAASDIFVLPSVREAFGLVLLEASALGLPIVASNVGGIPEIIENGKTGILVPPEDPPTLSMAIADLIQNSEKAVTLGKNACSRMEIMFNAKMMAERTGKVYDGVLDMSLRAKRSNLAIVENNNEIASA